MWIRYVHGLLSLLLLMACGSSLALPVTWVCTATDKFKLAWQASGPYEMTVVTAAIAACKKNSRMPQSCQSKAWTCETYINGMPTKPLWECSALDALAHVWKNEPSLVRDDAALAAKERCLHNSPKPESCYINMVSCINLRAAYEFNRD